MTNLTNSNILIISQIIFNNLCVIITNEFLLSLIYITLVVLLLGISFFMYRGLKRGVKIIAIGSGAAVGASKAYLNYQQAEEIRRRNSGGGGSGNNNDDDKNKKTENKDQQNKSSSSKKTTSK
jgi:hypothetical protein